MKHGIAVRSKKTNQLVEFIECDVGRDALKILSGIRINMNHEDYKADETYVKEEEIDLI